MTSNEGQWSLLVQRVDEWFPEVMALRGCVDFLPQWRFDDIMVSYATDGAGVGHAPINMMFFYSRVRGKGTGKLAQNATQTHPPLAKAICG